MFEKYLNEAKKIYEFNIGLAGELPEGIEDTLETAMKRFNVATMGSGKKTPIQERPLDFPQLSNCEVTYYDVSVTYPTTPQVLEEYISQCCGVDRSNIIVRNSNDPRMEYQEAKGDEPYETLLDKEDMGGESAQKNAGSERVMELLKELENARKENEYSPIADVKAADTKDITDTEGTKSPVGSN